nr:hypothetical protein GCM10020241_61610 [Streptoalloteichus tenebrarius]
MADGGGRDVLEPDRRERTAAPGHLGVQRQLTRRPRARGVLRLPCVLGVPLVLGAVGDVDEAGGGHPVEQLRGPGGRAVGQGGGGQGARQPADAVRDEHATTQQGGENRCDRAGLPREERPDRGQGQEHERVVTRGRPRRRSDARRPEDQRGVDPGADEETHLLPQP